MVAQLHGDGHHSMVIIYSFPDAIKLTWRACWAFGAQRSVMVDADGVMVLGQDMRLNTYVGTREVYDAALHILRDDIDGQVAIMALFDAIRERNST